jgi:hypothetical protein
MAISRQRPGTAKGRCFISLETGIANLFWLKTTFHTYRFMITAESFFVAEGRVRSSRETKQRFIRPMLGSDATLLGGSHDFP